MPIKRVWAPLAGIASLALALRLAYLFEIRFLPNLPTPNPALNATQPDRYASLLAGLSPHFAWSWLIPWVVQPALSATIPLLLYVIGRRAFSRPVGLLAAFMGAIYGPLVIAEGLALPSAVASLLTCLALLGLLVAQQRGRGRDWLLAGIAIMLLVLFQSNTLENAAPRADVRLDHQLSLRALGQKLRLAFTAAELGPNGYSDEKIRRQGAVRRLPLFTFAVVGPLGLLGLLLSLKRWRAIGLLHVAFFAYLGSLLVSVISGMTRLPLIPPLLVFAAFAVCWGYERAVEDARRPLAVAGAALVLLTLLTQLPVPISEPEAVTRVEEPKPIAFGKREIQARGAPVEESSSAGHEGYRVHLRRAGLYSSQGKLEKAVQEFERAAALAPATTSLDIRIRLALSLEEGGRYSEAKRRWEEVAAIGPPPEIAELARRHLIRIERKLLIKPPLAAEQKGVGKWERDIE